MSFSSLKVSGVLGLSLVAVFAVVLRPAASQTDQPTPMKDGHPDFNGYWVAGGEGAFSGQQFERAPDGSILFDFSVDQGREKLCESDGCQAPNQPPYKPEYMAKVKAIGATEVGGTTALDPDKSCKPLGVPRSSDAGEIIQTPRLTAIIHADYTDRLIYTDGRPHPSDLDPSWMGHSIGHWEGSTLVVDTTGFNDETWLGGDAVGTHIYTSIHSDKEHVIERWTREGDQITVQTTVEDPVMFTRPWVLAARKIHLAKSADPDNYLITYYCDASGIVETMRQHYIKPSPQDRDLKYGCSGHHCDPTLKDNSTGK